MATTLRSGRQSRAAPGWFTVLAWPLERLAQTGEQRAALRRVGVFEDYRTLTPPYPPTLVQLVLKQRSPGVALAAAVWLDPGTVQYDHTRSPLPGELLKLVRPALQALAVPYDERFLAASAAAWGYIAGAGGGHLRLEVQFEQARAGWLQLQDWYPKARAK